MAAQASLSLPWSETPEDRFSRDVAHMLFISRFLWFFIVNIFKIGSLKIIAAVFLKFEYRNDPKFSDR